ncbi:unnamed protein product [Ectocarpus sp. 12 AP-2014]
MRHAALLPIFPYGAFISLAHRKYDTQYSLPQWKNGTSCYLYHATVLEVYDSSPLRGICVCLKIKRLHRRRHSKIYNLAFEHTLRLRSRFSSTRFQMLSFTYRSECNTAPSPRVWY